MIDFTLSKTQQAAREYAHQVALEEMRPISLECDRTREHPRIVLLEHAEALLGRRGGAGAHAGTGH